MNLIWFLTIGTVLSTILGEFGQFPFASNFSISITDFLLGLTLMFLLIWQIGIKKEIIIPKGFKLLLLFWAVAGISLIVSGNLNGGFYLARFILYSSSFYLGYLLLRKRQIKEIEVIYLVIIPIAVMALLGFLQLVIYPDLARLEVFGYDPHKNRLVSTFLDPNYAGAFLNIGLIFSLYFFIKKKEFKWFNFASGFLIAIILTFSRSAYLMTFVALILLGVRWSRKILVALFIGSILIFAFVPRVQERVEGIWKLDVTVRDRLESYKTGFEIFKSHPLLGVGFNNISTAVEEYNLLRVHQSDETHSISGVDSSVLFILATTGIIGFFIYFFFWGFILLKFIKGGELSLVISFLIIALFINSKFINSLFYPPILLMTFLLSGVFYAKHEND